MTVEIMKDGKVIDTYTEKIDTNKFESIDKKLGFIINNSKQYIVIIAQTLPFINSFQHKYCVWYHRCRRLCKKLKSE